MFKKIAIALAVVVVVAVLAFVVVVAMQPDTYHVERSRTIDAPAFVVFNNVNNFKRWQAWSPWAELDPAMEKKFSGPEAGVGSVYEWSGNDQVGKGKMTIKESVPEKKVVITLEFIEPWEDTGTTTLSFQREAAETKVTWAMDGENDFMGKAMCLFMDMDQMIGTDYEKGLAKLDKVAEKEWAEIQRARAEKAKAGAQPVADAPAAAAPAAAQP